MVKRGLKVGQTFEDGGFTYKVTKVNQDGSYESKRVVPVEEQSETAEETESVEDSEPAEKKSSGRKDKKAQ